LAKQLRTETQLLDLVWAHVERFHRGPLLDGAQFIRVIRVANDPNRNWRIAYSGVAEDHAVALDEAEAELTELYDLSSCVTIRTFRSMISQPPVRFDK
jgi:hypothetical protein